MRLIFTELFSQLTEQDHLVRGRIQQLLTPQIILSLI
jgi:hypothetical protein